MAAVVRPTGCNKTESHSNSFFLARVEGAAHKITSDEKEGGAECEINSVETGLYRELLILTSFPDLFIASL